MSINLNSVCILAPVKSQMMSATSQGTRIAVPTLTIVKPDIELLVYKIVIMNRGTMWKTVFWNSEAELVGFICISDLMPWRKKKKKNTNKCTFICSLLVLDVNTVEFCNALTSKYQAIASIVVCWFTGLTLGIIVEKYVEILKPWEYMQEGKSKRRQGSHLISPFYFSRKDASSLDLG